MTQKEKLDSEISKIWDIYLIGKECFDYARYLYHPRTNLEKQYLEKQNDFGFIRHILFRNSLIELSKLFCDRKSEKYNIHKLLQNLKEGQYYGDMFREDLKILIWEQSIFKRTELILKITTLRDKVYSHTDPDFETNLDIDFDEISGLFDIVNDIITTICDKIFNCGADLGNIYFDFDRFNVIDILAKEKENRLKKYLR